jgi:hypothetical protein
VAATEFSLEHRVPGGAFGEIFRGPGLAFSHSGLAEGTRHDYRVFAIVVNGFQDSTAQEVRSAASPIRSATTFAFTPAFTLPPGTFTTDQTGLEGTCIVQRLSQPLLLAGGTQVRMRVRGSTAASLTLDRLTISQPAATGDEYDSAPDLTDVIASPLTIPANTVVTVGPVNYTLDSNQDLLIAFDIGVNNGNPRFGPLTGCDVYARSPVPPAPSPPIAEAGVQDRTAGYAVALDNIYLIETIEVL